MIRIALEILCAIVTVLLLLWMTIQAMRSVAFLGISHEPPGIAYATST
jgi:hypothetical protein